MMRGSCHCGAVRYTADLDPTEAIDCNCSICRKKGSVLAFTSPDTFTLETPREALAVYTWNHHVIRHQFCKICGCAPFAEGVGPNGPMVAINLRCADDFDLGAIKISPFDGANI
jgi:hypothetical protein